MASALVWLVIGRIDLVGLVSIVDLSRSLYMDNVLSCYMFGHQLTQGMPLVVRLGNGGYLQS